MMPPTSKRVESQSDCWSVNSASVPASVEGGRGRGRDEGGGGREGRGELTGGLDVEWQPEEEGVAYQLVEEESKGILNHTLGGGGRGRGRWRGRNTLTEELREAL